jgi:multicomponent Na+:H+ antiporter subunit B
MIDKKQSLHSEVNVIKPLADFLLGFIFIFAFYIQFHGKISPGGGFQSGIVLAVGFMIHDAILLISSSQKDFIIKDYVAHYIAGFGVLIYALTGLVCFFFGGKIFEYAVLHINLNTAQQIGIFGIETGVCVAVFGSMLTIYLALRKYAIQHNHNNNIIE